MGSKKVLDNLIQFYDPWYKKPVGNVEDPHSKSFVRTSLNSQMISIPTRTTEAIILTHATTKQGMAKLSLHILLTSSSSSLGWLVP